MHSIDIESRQQPRIEEKHNPQPRIEEKHNPSKMVVASSPNPSNKSPYNLLEDPNPNQLENLEANLPQTTKLKSKKLKLLPLIFLIFFEVSGGPFGEEPAVKAAGPLYALLGFLIFPFIWSIPEALITAELATAYPGNGGYVIWAEQAFGPFWGFFLGSCKFLSGVINNAAYPVLCVDYLKLVIPFLAKGLGRYLGITGSTLLLAFVNYTGLTIVGYGAVALGVISLCPFILMACISIPKIHPHRWIDRGQKWEEKDWNLFFNTLFWNLNFWDNASTLAGEVNKPQTTFPKALFSAGFLSCLGYLIPLIAIIGSLTVDQNKWGDGFLAEAAGMIAGNWLKIWVEIAAVFSAVGLFEAQLSSSSFQLLGMADLGILPTFFAKRCPWFDTPWVGILVSSLITLGVSYLNFTVIISSANFLYGLGMLLEIASFIWLRRKYPTLKRPYRVPMRIPGLICMCLLPTGFVIFVMAIATKMVYVLSASLIVLSVCAYFLMDFVKSRNWLEFGRKIEEKDEQEEEEE